MFSTTISVWIWEFWFWNNLCISVVSDKNIRRLFLSYKAKSIQILKRREKYLNWFQRYVLGRKKCILHTFFQDNLFCAGLYKVKRVCYIKPFWVSVWEWLHLFMRFSDPDWIFFWTSIFILTFVIPAELVSTKITVHFDLQSDV